MNARPCCESSCCSSSTGLSSAVGGHAEVALRDAHERDRAGILTLLNTAGLPTADISSSGVRFVVAERGTTLDGVVGFEIYGRVALLRSFAVAPERRRTGLGGRLVDHACAVATLTGVDELYLLTTTAAAFFERRGFARVERERVPTVVRSTAEFASLCPASALCMHRALVREARYFPLGSLPLRADPSGAAFWGVQLERVMLTYFEVPPNAQFERHSHEAEQITMVLEGLLVFECDHRPPVRVRAGETIALPSGVPHAVVAGENGARAVDAWSPPRTMYAASAVPDRETTPSL